jgi:SpoVK/Ycf46/Vps4 family AAA+-type ATPase
MMDEEELQSLLEALAHSPGNMPLRKHIADVQLRLGRIDEAEAMLREALKLAPGDMEIKLRLAKVYRMQGKHSAALVILENLVKASRAPAEAFLVYSRLLLNEGKVEQAVEAYKRAVEKDPDLNDPGMEEQLGIGYRAQDSEVVDGRVRMREADEEEGFDPEQLIERPKIRFDDVGGMEKLKEQIRVKIIHPIRHPEIYEAYNKPIGGGILMYGPPGCGKTYLARATAGEVKAGFLSVGLNDVLEMWIGNSERNLHAVFDYARRKTPCVLFFDEVDALGASRSDLRKSGGSRLVNQFLMELDGDKHSNEGVLILAATNAPWHLDSAFRRPGRFDRILFVPPPDRPARTEIIKVMLKGKPADAVDHELLARKTQGYSGADLMSMVDVAVESKLEEAMKKGVPEPIGTPDLKKALKSVKPTTKEWFATARNHALYSNQGGIYDDILDYLKLR